MNYIKISKEVKKEIVRYAISFFFAWLVSALISDFPIFRDVIKSIKLDVIMTNLLVFVTEGLLNLFNLTTYSEGGFLKINGTPGIIFVYGCLGFREVAFFIVFVIFQFGAVKHKIWYIPSGIVLLILLNAIRAAIIAFGQYLNANNTQLIHDIVSPVIMYPAILFLWLFWIRVYGKQV